MSVYERVQARRATLSPAVLAAALGASVLVACTEPTFVSLGRNLQQVARPDAGAVAACSEPLSGCDDAPADPPSCELGTPSVALDAACDTRRPVACPDSLTSDPARLNRLLSDLLGGCSGRAHYLAVLFSGGCASAFSLEPLDAPGAEAASACIAARLGAESYACAESLDCGVGSTFGAPIAR
ncbi:MAG: hypothetical protein ABI895_38760 [Deltaproteobacteria bacterium]